MKKLMKSELFKALLGLIGLALIIAAILGVRRAVYYMTFRSELDLPESAEYTVNIYGPLDGVISLSGEDALDIIGAARELSFAGPINRDIYQGSVNDYDVTISGQSGYAKITLFELDNPVLWTPERDVKLGNTGPLLDAVEAAYSYATDIELPAEPYSELSTECEWFTLRDASASMLEGAGLQRVSARRRGLSCSLSRKRSSRASRSTGSSTRTQAAPREKSYSASA